MKDYYQILGVSTSASFDEIKIRYRFLAQAFHPDRFQDSHAKAQAEGEMKELNEAYSVLSNPSKRTEYDHQRTTGKTSQSQSTESIESAMVYLKQLTIKWEKTIFPMPQESTVANLLNSLAWLTNEFVIYSRPGIRRPDHEAHGKEFGELITISMLMNLSLGAEEASTRIDPRFEKAKLTLYSTLPIQIKLNELLEKANSNNRENSIQLEQLMDAIGQTTYRLCLLCQEIGGQRARQSRSVRQETTAQPNTPVSPSHQNDSSRSVPQDRCQSCGRFLPVTKAEFNQNIGIVILRFTRHVEGMLCAHCMENFFWEFTAKTLLFGWWGFTSLFLTPFILLGNIYNYSKGRQLRSLAKDVNRVAQGYRFVGSVLLILLLSATSFLVIRIVVNTAYPTSVTVLPTTTPRPTSLPTRTPRPRSNLPPTQSSSKSLFPAREDCYTWDQVTEKLVGQIVCAKGIVIDAYWADKTLYFIRFSEDLKSLRFYSTGSYYYPDLIGKCALARGTLEVIQDVPMIDVTDGLMQCD